MHCHCHFQYLKQMLLQPLPEWRCFQIWVNLKNFYQPKYFLTVKSFNLQTEIYLQILWQRGQRMIIHQTNPFLILRSNLIKYFDLSRVPKMLLHPFLSFFPKISFFFYSFSTIYPYGQLINLCARLMLCLCQIFGEILIFFLPKILNTPSNSSKHGQGLPNLRLFLFFLLQIILHSHRNYSPLSISF